MFKEDSLCECFSFDADAIAPSLDGVLSGPTSILAAASECIASATAWRTSKNPSYPQQCETRPEQILTFCQ